MKKILIIIVLVIALGGYGFYYYSDNLTPVNKGETKIITIEEGSSSQDIGFILLENNLIRDINVYKIYLRYHNLSGNLKAGDYEIKDSLNLAEIINLISQGGNIEKTKNITIPEGLNIEEVAEIMAKNFDIKAKDFIAQTEDVESYRKSYEFLQEEEIITLEGFLFPDTYNLFMDNNPKDIIIVMLDRFDQIYQENIKENLEDKSLKEIITMASVVQGEGQLDEERPVIASVFYNRLDIDMMLQSCATVQYALGERKEKLLNEDLEVDSLYNTYLHIGLPPAPINSPGLSSIEAALNPDDTEYIYFLAKGDGSHYFTDDYDDFLDAKDKYIN